MGNRTIFENYAFVQANCLQGKEFGGLKRKLPCQKSSLKAYEQEGCRSLSNG